MGSPFFLFERHRRIFRYCFFETGKPGFRRISSLLIFKTCFRIQSASKTGVELQSFRRFIKSFLIEPRVYNLVIVRIFQLLQIQLQFPQILLQMLPLISELLLQMIYSRRELIASQSFGLLVKLLFISSSSICFFRVLMKNQKENITMATTINEVNIMPDIFNSIYPVISPVSNE